MFKLKSTMPPKGLGFDQMRARCKLVGGSGTLVKGTVVRLDLANTVATNNDEGSATSGLSNVILNIVATPGILGVLVNDSPYGYECDVDFGGIVDVVAGGTVAKSAGVVPNGSAQVAAAAATDNVIGLALSAGSTGNLMKVLWYGVLNFESGPP